MFPEFQGLLVAMDTTAGVVELRFPSREELRCKTLSALRALFSGAQQETVMAQMVTDMRRKVTLSL